MIDVWWKLSDGLVFNADEVQGVEVGEHARIKVTAIEMDVCSHVLKLLGNYDP